MALLFPSLLLLLLLPVLSLPVSAADAETCYFRQHQKVNVNLHLAASHASTVAAVARAVRSEQACVRACCSEEVKPGASVAVAGSEAALPLTLEVCKT